MAKGHGGARPGSGRKRGGKNTIKRSRAVVAMVDKLLEDVPEPFEGDSLALFQFIYRNPDNNLHLRLAAAAHAAPYERAKYGSIEPPKPVDDHVPLAERLKEYARQDAIDAIEASEGKVVALKGRSG